MSSYDSPYRIEVYCENNQCSWSDKADTAAKAKDLGQNHAKQGHVIGFEEVMTSENPD